MYSAAFRIAGEGIIARSWLVVVTIVLIGPSDFWTDVKLVTFLYIDSQSIVM